MIQRRLIALLGAIALAVAGCTSDDTADTTQAPASPSPDAASPSPVATPSPGASPAPGATKTATAKAQPAGQAKTGSSLAASGLIEPTNAAERAKQTQSQIDQAKRTGGSTVIVNGQSTGSDPFAGLPPKLEKPKTDAQPVRSLPSVPQAIGPSRVPSPMLPTPISPAASFPPRPRAVASRPTPSRSPQAAPTSGTSGGGSPTPTVAASPAPPPPPSTDNANGVEVSGVVTTGNTTQIILKAADEPTARYVQVGQRVSGGRVLVKRVNLQSDDPVVVLEENGVEVPKVVGQKPIGAQNPA